MRGQRAVRFGVVAALVVALGILAVPGSASAAPAPPPVAKGSTAGAAWDVTPTAGGWVVRLTLPTAVPIRAAQPQIAVDGAVVGVARQDPDGRTLRIVTTDRRVTSAGRVELAWNGVVAGTAPSSRRTSGPVTLPAQNGPVLAEDPAAATTYRVTRADYDLGDTAVRLPGLGGQAVELRAAVYLPAGAPGPRPVVVFLHGRHQPCYGRPTGGGGSDAAWPCPPGMLPVPSHLGYGKAAEALAAAGQVVVSISADGINALDYAADDGGAEARGELVLAHLDRLAAWNAGQGTDGPGAALVGRLDLSNVGLMGHSRGGEGVVKAALLNAERPSPYGIRAVMPLAPVDFLRSTLPDVPMAVVLPYCDGDVWDQQGQHFYDDTRYAASDDVLRTSLLVMGANHNYFNSEWTPGVSAAPSFDDWFDQRDPVCGDTAPSRLTPSEQRAVGASYIAGFFRLHLGGERRFLPMFDGTGARGPSVSRAVVYTEAQQPRSARTDLAPLQAASRSVHTSAGASYCRSYADPVAGQPAPCATFSRNPATLPHWTPAYLAQDVPATPVARLTWGYYGPPQQQISVDVTGVSRSAQALTFRAATARAVASDLLVTLTDTAGHSAGIRVSRVSSALSPLPALSDFQESPVAKTWLRTVRLPLAQFAGVDATRLATVTFASAGSTGSVYLSDLALDTPAAGAGGPSALPVVSVADAEGFGGARPSRTSVRVSLSRPSTVAVTAELQIGAGFGFGQVAARAVRVSFPAGVVSVDVPVALRPLPDDWGGGGPATYLNCLAVPTNAIVGDGLGTLTVYS